MDIQSENAVWDLQDSSGDFQKKPGHQIKTEYVTQFCVYRSGYRGHDKKNTEDIRYMNIRRIAAVWAAKAAGFICKKWEDRALPGPERLL